MKKRASTIILFLVLLIGLSLLLYPTFADWWNSFHQTRAIASYDAALAEMDEADFTAMFEAADEYNRRLAALSFPLMSYDQVAGYEEALSVSKKGIMGYIQYEKLDIYLPIYHGTSDIVLQVGVGHVQGSSLPVGGEGTHSVLSAHRGLPSARLFTDLDRAEIGDTFTITVLDRVLTYEVDQILIVEPHESYALAIEDGEDLCTLLTCTPYGINSHRMLVRGHRVENAEEVRTVRVTADAIQLEPVLVAPLLAAPMLLVLLIMLLIPKRKKRRKGSE